MDFNQVQEQIIERERNPLFIDLNSFRYKEFPLMIYAYGIPVSYKYEIDSKFIYKLPYLVGVISKKFWHRNIKNFIEFFEKNEIVISFAPLYFDLQDFLKGNRIGRESSVYKNLKKFRRNSLFWKGNDELFNHYSRHFISIQFTIKKTCWNNYKNKNFFQTIINLIKEFEKNECK